MTVVTLADLLIVRLVVFWDMMVVISDQVSVIPAQFHTLYMTHVFVIVDHTGP